MYKVPKVLLIGLLNISAVTFYVLNYNKIKRNNKK